MEKQCFGRMAGSTKREILFGIQDKEIFLLRLRNLFLGYCWITPENDGLYIQALTIANKYRGKKFGQELLKRTIEYIKSTQYNKVILHVSVGNNPAIYIYEKFGFEIIGTDVDFYSSEESAYIMELVLSE